ncbi:MAG: hypothetical protein ABSG50_02200 [Opitutaceae bacterium]|jgi:hypothetical protein
MRRFILLLFITCPLFAGSVIPILSLKSGKIYHDVLVVSDRPTVITVRCREGLFQVKKDDLPDELAKVYPVDKEGALREEKERTESIQKSIEAEHQREEKAKSEVEKRKAELDRKLVKSGCRIVSFAPVGPGQVMIEFKNETDAPQRISPTDVLCRATDGRVFDGGWLVSTKDGMALSTDPYPLPGNATIRLPTSFFQERGIDVSEIYWKQ